MKSEFSRDTFVSEVRLEGRGHSVQRFGGKERFSVLDTHIFEFFIHPLGLGYGLVEQRSVDEAEVLTCLSTANRGPVSSTTELSPSLTIRA